MIDKTLVKAKVQQETSIGFHDLVVSLAKENNVTFEEARDVLYSMFDDSVLKLTPVYNVEIV